LPVAQTTNTSAVQKAFAGTWKEDASKRKLDATAVPPVRFRIGTDGTTEELRGSVAQPTGQPVIFDGKPRQLPSGNSYAWRQLGAHSFERVSLSTEGDVLSTRRLTISADAKSLTEDLVVKGETESSTAKNVYQRTSTEPEGLVGTWKLTTASMNFAFEVKFEPVGTTALRVSSNQGSPSTLEIDGPAGSITGRGVAKGATEQLKVINPSTIEVTSATNGVETIKTTYQLSPDGKSMRMLITNLRAAGSPATPIDLTLLKQ